MKSVAQLAAVLAVLMLVGVAYAKEAKAKTVRGEVVKIDNGKITVKNNKGKETTINTDDNTKVTVEGAAAKVADLKAGQKVVITVTNGTATKVDVPKPKRV